MSTPDRFLIFNNGMIGNTLFNMSVAQWLKRTYPGCFVGMIVDEAGLDLVHNDPNVDVFHTFNKKKDGLKKQLCLVLALRKEKYTLSLHVRKGVRNELIARFAGVSKRAGYFLKGSPQHLHVNVVENVEVTRLRSRELLLEEVFEREVAFQPPALYPDAGAETELDAFLAANGLQRGEYAVLHPTGETRGGIRWSLDVFSGAVTELAKQMPVCVICRSYEKEAVEAVIPSGAHVVYYTGGIATTSALVRGAKVFFGSDSGPAHIACAWGVPRVVVYHEIEENFAKWQPADMTNCNVLWLSDFNSHTVYDRVMHMAEVGAE